MSNQPASETDEERVKALMNVEVLLQADNVEGPLGDFLNGFRDAVTELAKEIETINRWRAFKRAAMGLT
jgi:hypothetical protein